MKFLSKHISTITVLAGLNFCLIERYNEKISMPMFLYYLVSVLDFPENKSPFETAPGLINYIYNTLIFSGLLWLLFGGLFKKKYHLISSASSILLFSVLFLPDYKIDSEIFVVPTLFVVFNLIVLIVNLNLSKVFIGHQLIDSSKKV